MAKNIKNIVDRINTLAGKYEVGYFTPETIVEEVNRQSFALYTELIESYARTRRISEFLQPFMKRATPDFSGGAQDKPEDFEHHISLRTATVPVEILEHYEFETRRSHVNKPPSNDYPIGRYTATQIEVLPTTITTTTLEYFKLPVKAVYAYDVDGDDYVYNDDDSVALEWSEQMINKITLGTLSKLGIPVNDRDLVQYGLMQESKPKMTS